MTYNANYPVSADVLANPTALTNRDDAGFELHGVISRMQDILEALEAKLGIGASTPPAAAAVLRRTATGASGWGQVAGADIANGAVPPAAMQAGGTGNTFLHTSLGGVVAWTQIAAADVPANALNASSIFGGGTVNRVLRTTDGTNAIWGQVGGSDIVTNPVLVGTVTAGTKLLPSNQVNLGFDAPVSSVSVAPLAVALIGSNARMGLFFCVDGGSGQSAIFQLHGIGATVTLLVGSTALFDVVPSANSKVNVIYNSGSYFVYNGYAAARSMNGMFLGIGT